MTSSNTHRVRFGPFEADLDTHELWKNGIRVKLGGQPFEILALLLRRPGRMVTREELQKELWAADTFVDFNHGLNAAVNKLRETLADSAEEPKYVETLPRRGYRFVGKVEAALPVAVIADSTVINAWTGGTANPPLPAPPAGLGVTPDKPSRVTTTSFGAFRRWLSNRLVRTAIIGCAVATLLYWFVLPTMRKVTRGVVHEELA